MYRIDTDGNVDNMFDGGDPAVPRPPTRIDADYLNTLQEEPCNVIEATGVTLDKSDRTQLLTAIRALIALAITVLKGATNTWASSQIFSSVAAFVKGIQVVQGTSDSDGIYAEGNGGGAGINSVGGSGGSGGVFTGNGLGKGVLGTGGGTSGTGVAGVGGGPDGYGLDGHGTGAGGGVAGVGGATGPGCVGTGGTTSGAGGIFTATGGNSDGVTATGHGSGVGGTFTSGSTAGTTYAVRAIGAGTNNDGLYASADDSVGSNGLLADGGAGGQGVYARSTTSASPVVGQGHALKVNQRNAVRAPIYVVPTSQPTGASQVGSMYVDSGGVLKICTSAGTPGTWVSVGSQT